MTKLSVESTTYGDHHKARELDLMAENRMAEIFDIWNAANQCLSQRDAMGARALLRAMLPFASEKKFLPLGIDLITQYQSAMTKASHPFELTGSITLPFFKNAPVGSSTFISDCTTEIDRLNAKFAATANSKEMVLAYRFHQVLVGLAAIDGMKCFYWTDKTLQLLKASFGLHGELSDFYDYVRYHQEHILAQFREIDVAETQIANLDWGKSSYEGIELLRVHLLEIGVSSSHYDSFILRLPKFSVANDMEALH